ncbi:mono/diheme cytochrome c family protein [Mucilaginibacter yixingensis]|uniref:Mono/diheme cytochrome c family protein n=1 Tax=Mucilaginibacter yixingensis TaxID=1295612 RepID=A0A2T5JA14_9SPHI|nr:cytochrome c [Mucilaginibacter yixingensis]PTQ96905.1 mono/diheme cytochrome c family protein [Mucilaginibacter yixingensis]
MKKTLLILALTFASVAVFAQTKKKPVSKTKPVAGLAATITAGQKVYTTYCVSCHQADGGGVQNMNPPLIKTPYVLGDKVRMAKIVINGFSENVEINGDTYTNTMPALAMLKDEEIAAVLTYVRNSFGNKAPAVTVADVKKARAAKK